MADYVRINMPIWDADAELVYFRASNSGGPLPVQLQALAEVETDHEVGAGQTIDPGRESDSIHAVQDATNERLALVAEPLPTISRFLGWLPVQKGVIDFSDAHWFAYPTFGHQVFTVQIGDAEFSFDAAASAQQKNVSTVLWAVPHDSAPINTGYRVSDDENMDTARDEYDTFLRDHVEFENLEYLAIPAIRDQYGIFH